ncbi:hypothetical protein VTH82DRAFT_2296 [Thermothelomyces myriococcoides]
MPRTRRHRSSRRVPPLKDSDFDHEISLIDKDDEEEAALGPSSAGSSSYRGDGAASGAVSLRAGGESGPEVDVREQESPGQPSVVVEEPTPQDGAGVSATLAKTPHAHGKPKTPESAIDILYENQRGVFLCGIPLFSSKALGNLDPPPWTNFAHKPSPTDIYTAQVPDPSWEWAWPEWRINYDGDVDEDGWIYSFAFSNKFSWHKARWWNSFVRRRAWIRKRVKKNEGYSLQDPYLLNPDYFMVRPSSDMTRDRSPSRASTVPGGSRASMSTANMESVERPAIEDSDELLRVLRTSRIDREKIEVVDNYLANAKEEFGGLQTVMHEIIALFVFQASRRILLANLTEVYERLLAEQKAAKESNPELDRKVENLAVAIKHADEEVKRLEYWSDVKKIAEEGGSKAAVDENQGWDSKAWQGVDKSGPSAPSAPGSESKTRNGKEVQNGRHP